MCEKEIRDAQILSHYLLSFIFFALSSIYWHLHVFQPFFNHYLLMFQPVRLFLPSLIFISSQPISLSLSRSVFCLYLYIHMHVLGMTLNHTWWWGSCSGAPESIKSIIHYHDSQVDPNPKWEYLSGRYLLLK